MINDLLNKMTLQEKIAQLIQLSPDFYSPSGEITGPLNDVQISKEVVNNAGSILGVCGADEVRRVQDLHLETNRLKIPLLFMADVVHGYKTIFPVPLASACSFNLDMIEQSAKIAAAEASVSGVHVTFAPMADLARDPRWGRVMESAGEDPFYNSIVARAYVKGFQQANDFDSKQGLISCVKHFAGYGAVEAGRDYNYVDMSTRELYEKHLVAYKAALDEGANMVMTSFNTIDGIPASGHQWLLKDVLRSQFGFDGVIISDWGSVREMIAHGVASNEKDAAKLAMDATLDIEMMTNSYVSSLEALLEQGEIQIEQIDAAVLRVLKLKEQLGLFDNPYRVLDANLEKELILSDAHLKAAYHLAAESCVLLKNDNQVLPIQNNDKVALVGPVADSQDLLGPWSWKGDNDIVSTIKQAFSQHQDVLYAKGCHYHQADTTLLEEALQVANKADKIIMCLGEETYQSGEANCMSTIKISQAQIDLAKAMALLNKPMVLVLVNGRPLDLTELEPLFDSILETWFVGSAGGEVIHDLLVGHIIPSGKLTLSFPYNAGQIPVYYNTYHTGRPYQEHNAYTSKYLDIPNHARYPFGHGLSYTNFEISDIQISANTMTLDERLVVSATVKNVGTLAAKVCIQLYLQDLVGQVIRPVKELKAFTKISLESGLTQVIEFVIDAKMLAYYHSDMSFKSDLGTFAYYVGQDSTCTAAGEFELVGA